MESDGAPEGTYTVTAHKVVGKDPVMAAVTGYTFDGVTDWTPNACCYGDWPLAQADISPAFDAQEIDKTPGYKAWTITAMVQEWLATPATNFGLLLNSDPSKPKDRYRYFASMEHPDANLRPHLRVTYSVPISAACGSCQMPPSHESLFSQVALLEDLRPAQAEWILNAAVLDVEILSLPLGD